jgi:RNA polymerase sigma-70 factor (ECF subfamily)
LTSGVDQPVADNELVARSLVDRAEFGLLYDRYVTRIYRFCLRRLGNVAAAEDATSATFLKAIEALPAFRGGSFPAWLFAIANSVVITQVRRKSEAALDDADESVDPERSPEDQALSAEAKRTLAAMLREIPEDQRLVIELRLADLTGSEIAESMNRSVAAVKMLQHRAMKRLRELASGGPGNKGSDR